MLSFFKLAVATLITLITISFGQDVILSIDGTNLNYVSTSDIAGWQFSHDGCAANVNGGDWDSAGGTITCGDNTCLGFIFGTGTLPAGTGTLVDLGGTCSTLGGLIFSDPNAQSVSVELVDGGDPVLPTVSILSPADGSSFDDATSVDVEVSCSDCGEDDHYHVDLDDVNQGMFYTDNFSVDVGFGVHTLTVTLADGGHAEYDHDGSSASVSFSVLETSAGGCDDPSACNDGDAVNDCIYPDADGCCAPETDLGCGCGNPAASDDNHNCDGTCGGVNNATDAGCGCGNPAASDDNHNCDGTCGGVNNATTDACGVCGGDGSACSPVQLGLQLNAGNLEVTYDSPFDFYGFQFDVTGVTVISASGGAAAANVFTVTTQNNSVLGVDFGGGTLCCPT